MRLRLFAIAFVAAAAAFAVCSGCRERGGPLVDSFVPAMGKRSLPSAEAPPPPAPMAVGKMASDAAGSGSAEALPRRVIRSSQLSVEVKDVDEAAEKARGIVIKVGGFVANSRATEDDAGRKAMELTLRVPEERLDAAAAALKELGRVRDDEMRGEDVTEQYVDLEARLANAKRLEARLIDLLAKSSNRLKDLLDVERELSRVRESIETMEAHKRFLDNRTTLATIELSLVQPPGWGRGIFDPLTGSIQRSLSAFTSSLAVLVVVVSAALPWLVLLFAMGWLGLRFLRWRIRRRRELKEQKQGHDGTAL